MHTHTNINVRKVSVVQQKSSNPFAIYTNPQCKKSVARTILFPILNHKGSENPLRRKDFPIS